MRIFVSAGAHVNARDKDGNTPLHETFLTDVAEELLRLGANVNARNHDGETPIFATVDDDAIPLFLRYGADLSIRNNAGQTVIEAATTKVPDVKLRWPRQSEAAAQIGRSTVANSPQGGVPYRQLGVRSSLSREQDSRGWCVLRRIGVFVSPGNSRIRVLFQNETPHRMKKIFRYKQLGDMIHTHRSLKTKFGGSAV